MFTDVIPLIVTPDEVEILLELSEKKGQTIKDLSKFLDLPRDKVESIINGLFVKGFLKKTRDGDSVRAIRYSLKSFRNIVSRYLSEDKKELLGEYVVTLVKFSPISVITFPLDNI